MKLNHPVISSFVKQEALAALIFQQAQTLLCFSLGLQEEDKSPPCDKVTAGFTTHPREIQKHLQNMQLQEGRRYSQHWWVF